MKVIAITGGPCAGKTSAMGELRTQLQRIGLHALFIPEAATDLIQSGVAPWTCASMLEFQTHVIALQLRREDSAFAQAAASDAVVICDRGICDSHAYLSDGDFARALAANGIDEAHALGRYDAVFHLESIAKDDPDAYTKDNNSARFENAAEAVVANERVGRAWSGHPALTRIGNHRDFSAKAAELCTRIVRCLGRAHQANEPLDAHGAGAPREPREADAIASTAVAGRELAAGANMESAPILVSACLLGEPCRYDGKAFPCPAIIAMSERHEVVSVCPEQLGGLPTPRAPSEIQPDGRVVDTAGIDRTSAFEAGAREALRIAREHGCKQAVLKENSPSCGVNKVYDGTFSGTLVPGMGETAALLSHAGIELASDEEVFTYDGHVWI